MADGPTVAQLLKELEVERSRVVEAEETLRQSGEAGQMLLVRCEALETELEQLREKALESHGDLTGGKLEAMRQQNQALEEELERLRRQVDSKIQQSPAPSFQQAEEKAAAALAALREDFEDSQKEWEERLQEAAMQKEALAEELRTRQAEQRRAEADLAQMRAEQEMLNAERERLLEAERQLKEQLERQARRHSSVASLPGTQSTDSDSFVVKLEAMRLKEDLTRLLMDSEARCLQLEDEIAHTKRLLEAEQQAAADLKLRNEELEKMMSQHWTPGGLNGPDHAGSLGKSLAQDLSEPRRSAVGPDSPQSSFKESRVERPQGMAKEWAAANGEAVRLGSTFDDAQRQQDERRALELEEVPEQLTMNGEFQDGGRSPQRSQSGHAEVEHCTPPIFSCNCGCLRVCFYKPLDERSIPLRSAAA